MNNFYQEWKAYQNKYSVSYCVVCWVPLYGYFNWKEDIYRCDASVKQFWPANSNDLYQLDLAVERATCTLFAIPFSGLHGVQKLELMYGNGKGSFVAYYDSGLTPRAADKSQRALKVKKVSGSCR